MCDAFQDLLELYMELTRDMSLCCKNTGMNEFFKTGLTDLVYTTVRAQMLYRVYGFMNIYKHNAKLFL
jgi:hypothetical protein